MNITRIDDSTKILQKTRSSISTFGGGSTSGKYVYINSSLTKNSQNNYTVNISLSCSSGQVFNGYGINVYAVIGGTSHYLGSPTISSGSFSTKNFAKAFSVGSNTAVYARCICAACESGQHSTDRSKFENSTSADTAVYVNPTIIPYAPNPTMSWGRGNTITSAYGDTVYSGGISGDDGSQNYTNFDCGMPGNAVSVTLSLDRYVNGDWQNVANGYPSFRKNWTNEDRGFAFRLRSWSTSSTGHTTSAASFPQWRINDLPSIDGSRISFNAPRTTDNITLSWPVLSDGLNSSNANCYRIHLQKLVNGSYSDFRSFDISNVTSANFNLSSYGFNNGDRCRAQIEPGDALEWAHNRQGSTLVVRNSAPYFSAGTSVKSNVDGADYNKVFKDAVNLSWNSASDNEGDALTYLIKYKAQNSNGSWQSNWTDVIRTSNRSETISCQNYVSLGRSIQFAVEANDGLENSGLITSLILTRDANPPTPTGIVINPNQSEEHYESISSVSWNSSTGTNGQLCSSYEIDMIVCRTNNVSSAYSTISKKSTSTSIRDFSIADITRGHYFYFRVKAVDMYGLSSVTYLESKWCRKNKAPYAPTGFKINSSRLNLFQNAPLIWDVSSDPDGDNITYSIMCSVNRGNYYSIATGLTSNTYSHNISDRNPKDTLGYKIVSIDKHGVSSTETVIENNHSIVINTKPEPAILMYPVSVIYDTTPRILLNTNGDYNGDELTIKISINGQNYNSATSSAFNKSSYNADKDKIVFIPPTLNIGVNTFTIKTNDGYQDSNESTFIINCATPLLNTISDTADVFITPATYISLSSMVSNTRIAYGLTIFNAENMISKESFVTASSFNALYENIIQVNNWINNNYPGKNRVKTKPLIAKSNLIGKNIHNGILEVITNI